MSYLFIFLWMHILWGGFQFALIETELSSTISSGSSRTIAEFRAPSQISCVHKCYHLSSKMFYNDNLCICFEENENGDRKEENEWSRQGVVMATLQMKTIPVSYNIYSKNIKFTLYSRINRTLWNCFHNNIL